MFRRKKNASKDSAISRESFSASRDSSAVASPSAVSDAGSGMNTSALFINDYRDHRRPDQVPPPAQQQQTQQQHQQQLQYQQPPQQQVQQQQVYSAPATIMPAQQMLYGVPNQYGMMTSSREAATPRKPASFAASVDNIQLDTHCTELEQHNRMLSSRLIELKNKRDALLQESRDEEEEQKKFEATVELLKGRLNEVTRALNAEKDRSTALDKLIIETENGYNKLVETSKMILGLLENDLPGLH